MILAFIFSLCVAFWTALVWRRLSFNWFALRGLPGPPVPSQIVGNALDLKNARVGTRYNIWAKKYGHTYRLTGPLLEPWLIMGDPKGLTHVLSGKNYVRPELDRVALERFFGRGLFCTEGEEHRKMRKTLNAPFTGQSVQEISHILFDLSHRLKSQWEELTDTQAAVVFDIASHIHMLTLDAISMTMFSHNLSATEGKIPGLLHNITNSPGGDTKSLLLEALASMFPFLLGLPSPMKSWADNLRTELGVIASEVWAGKQNAGLHAKVLDSLAEEGKAGRQPISRDEAVAQIIGILFAGSETVANVISECFYELSRKPHIQNKLRQELVAFDESHGREPTYDELMNPAILPYLDSVTRETMRTKAVLMDISRAALEDDIIPLQFPIRGTNIKEVKVKAGQLINIPVRDGVNVDEEIWGSDAADYRPERWTEEGGLPETVHDLHAQGNILTFGDGPKVCLGRIFALAEFKIVVSTIVRFFAFENDQTAMDFYHLGGNTVKPLVRGRENEGVQMPLPVRRI